MDIGSQDPVAAATTLWRQLAYSRRRLLQLAESRSIDSELLTRGTRTLAQEVDGLASMAEACLSQYPDLAAATGRSGLASRVNHLVEDGGSLRVSARSRQELDDGLARVRTLMTEARSRRFGRQRLVADASQRASACRTLVDELRQAAAEVGSAQGNIDRRYAAERQACLTEAAATLGQSRLALDVALASASGPQLPWNDPRWTGCGVTGVLQGGPFHAGWLRPRADPALGRDAAVGTDLLIPLFVELEGHLQVRYDEASRTAALAMIQSLMLRRFVTAPPGHIQFHVFDPVGLGGSVAEMLPVADFNSDLLGGKIWSGPEELRDLLKRTSAHLEVVVQKYLRTEFDDIESFNRSAGELAEPTRYLVLFDYPAGVSAESARELKRIMTNGNRCGVHLLLGVNRSRSDFDDGSVMRSVEGLRTIDLGMAFTAEAEGHTLALDYVPDPLEAGSAALKALLPEIGKTSTLARDSIIPLERVLFFYRDAVARGMHPQRKSDVVVPTLRDPESWWHESSAGGLSAPIGQRGAREAALLTLDSGDHSGALLVGRPGSGKSTLLHSYLAGLTMQYDPDELELYLVDFKEGVEFQAYAAEGLPHARCVAIESDREFGLSVLQSLAVEISRRGERLRSTDAHHVGLDSLREATGEQMARVLLVFDEFHVLFARNDKVGLAAAEILEQVIRQGRSFGIHVLLASQSLSGLDALGSHVPQLLPVRILLPASDADGRRVLGEANDAGHYLTSKGEGVLNPAGGATEANEQFRGALLDEETRLGLLRALRAKADGAGIVRRPVVFDGRALVPLSRFDLRTFTEETRASGPGPLRLRIGLPMSVNGAADVSLRREAGANILLVARPESPSPAMPDQDNIPLAQLIALLASLVTTDATVNVVDFLSIDEDVESKLGPLAGCQNVTVLRSRRFPEVVRRAAELVAQRAACDDMRAPTVVLALYGLHRARILDASAPELSHDPECGDLLEQVLRDGPEVGVHTWVWADTFAGTTRRLGSSALREFGWRVAGKMSAEDSERLLNSDIAASLRRTQLVVMNDDLGVTQRTMGLGPPEASWLDELVASRLHLQKSQDESCLE